MKSQIYRYLPGKCGRDAERVKGPWGKAFMCEVPLALVEAFLGYSGVHSLLDLLGLLLFKFLPKLSVFHFEQTYQFISCHNFAQQTFFRNRQVAKQANCLP